jgi:hypothetical protein
MKIIYVIVYIENMESVEAARSKIGAGVCPCCLKQFGGVSPRATCIAHMRKSRNVEHMIFRTCMWKRVFLHGKHSNKEPERVPDDLIEAIGRYYGRGVLSELATRIPFHCT